MNTKRIVIREQGPAGVMALGTAELPAPDQGEVQIEQTAIGLNYMDVYQRSGHYPLNLPSPLGLEGAGRITAVGPGVSNLSVGDRVVYGGVLGAYATHRNAPAGRVLRIPDDISDEIAAAVLMKGMTVEYLLERCYHVRPGQDVLFFAASGGVGLLAGQWGSFLGARMIGVTSGPKNCELIKQFGYAEAIDRTSDDIADRVKSLTDGTGVPVVYDSIGKATFETSIACLSTYGMFVSFGATTGEAPPVPPSLLQKSGSLYFTRPTLADYVASRADLEHSAARVFDMIRNGHLRVNVGQTFALSDAVAAHDALESGQTTGSTLLVP